MVRRVVNVDAPATRPAPWPTRLRHVRGALFSITLGALVGTQFGDNGGDGDVAAFYAITVVTVVAATTLGGLGAGVFGTACMAALFMTLDGADGGLDFDDAATIERPLMMLLIGGCVAIAVELVTTERHRNRVRAAREARLAQLDANLASLDATATADTVGELASQVAAGDDDPAFVDAVNARVHIALTELEHQTASRAGLDADRIVSEMARALVPASSVDEVKTTVVDVLREQLHRAAEICTDTPPSNDARLLSADDRPVGWLVVHGALDADGDEVVERLSPLIAASLERAARFDELAFTATTLERSLLPEALLPVPNLEVATRYLPATSGHEVGGDFYDAVRSPDGRVTLIVGDVQGKGVEAATVTSLARHTLRTGALEGDRPAELLTRLNEALLYGQAEQVVAGHDPMIRFVTAAVACLTPQGDGFGLTVACGGQPPPLLVRQGGSVDVLGPAGMLLGVSPRPTFEELETRMDLAETLVLYTDGVTEQRRSEHVFDEHMLGLMVRNRLGPADAEAIAQLIQDTVLLVSPEDVRDDVAVVVARVTGTR